MGGSEATGHVCRVHPYLAESSKSGSLVFPKPSFGALRYPDLPWEHLDHCLAHEIGRTYDFEMGFTV